MRPAGPLPAGARGGMGIGRVRRLVCRPHRARMPTALAAGGRADGGRRSQTSGDARPRHGPGRLRIAAGIPAARGSVDVGDLRADRIGTAQPTRRHVEPPCALAVVARAIWLRQRPRETPFPVALRLRCGTSRPARCGVGNDPSDAPRTNAAISRTEGLSVCPDSRRACSTKSRLWRTPRQGSGGRTGAADFPRRRRGTVARQPSAAGGRPLAAAEPSGSAPVRSVSRDVRPARPRREARVSQPPAASASRGSVASGSGVGGIPCDTASILARSSDLRIGFVR